jgi:hypothetical protein
MPYAGLSEMELAGLEPATSWVRYRVRKPNRGDLSSLRCSKFAPLRSVWYPTWYLGRPPAIAYSDSPTASRASSLLAKGSIRTILPSRNVSSDDRASSTSSSLVRPLSRITATT